jgi:hypothetical protein
VPSQAGDSRPEEFKSRCSYSEEKGSDGITTYRLTYTKPTGACDSLKIAKGMLNLRSKWGLAMMRLQKAEEQRGLDLSRVFGFK